MTMKKKMVLSVVVLAVAFMVWVIGYTLESDSQTLYVWLADFAFICFVAGFLVARPVVNIDYINGDEKPSIITRILSWRPNLPSLRKKKSEEAETDTRKDEEFTSRPGEEAPSTF